MTPGFTACIGNYENVVKEALKSVEKDRVAERLFNKDASLWKSDSKHQAIIKNALGWLNMPEVMAKAAGELKTFTDEVISDGCKHVVVLGMGGSSLAPEVFRTTFGPRVGYPVLHVLDSTDPEAVSRIDKEADPGKTLYIVASKSGTTTEPMRFFDYFYFRVQAVARASGAAAALEACGSHFAAITDPGTYLEKQAKEKKFRKTFINPSDIGGRYSAISYFGLVPCALAGINVKEILERASGMFHDCSNASVPAQDNPGVWLGAVLGALALKGRDKITFLLSPELHSLGLWLEQLLAESTGKEGRGVVPIAGEPGIAVHDYGNDRIFVQIKLKQVGSDDEDKALDKFSGSLERAGHPVIHIELKDKTDICAEFYRWEIATAVLGHFLGINPFDQPNVQEAKDRTNSILKQLESSGNLPSLPAHVKDDSVVLSFSDVSWKLLQQSGSAIPAGTAINRFLSQCKSGDYIALLPYLSSFGEYETSLGELRGRLIKTMRVPVQFGYGPRYLHSTGQLHKGGPNTGLFVILRRSNAPDLKIAGVPYTFGQLRTAQSLGDFQALDASGRRAVYIDVGGNPNDVISKIVQAIQ